jgi:hypothetical protein
MNLAVGFSCPSCGHDVADVLEFVKDEFQFLTSNRLCCVRCDTVYIETREPKREVEDLALELLSTRS